ncbi:MAG: diguanylate cyclase domain-containing protein [Nocardioidaceae bacterium]
MQETAAFLAALLRRAHDIVTVVDEHGTVRYVNDAPAEILGTRPEDALGEQAIGFVHPDDAAHALERRAWLLAHPGESSTTVLRVRCADGWRHVETTGVNLLDDPVVCGLLYVSRDVEDRFREQQERSRSILGHRVVAQLGLRALGSPDLDAFLGEVMEHAGELLGASAVRLRDLPGREDRELLRPDEPEGSGPPQQVPLVGPTGRLGVLTVVPGGRGFGDLDRALLNGVANVLTSALIRAEREQQALLAALHDGLTGLATRPLLYERLSRALSHPRKDCALLMVDLDGFKAVNDSLGHAAGDEVLAELGRRLQTCVRPTDIVARYGGDEFVVLCEEAVSPQVVADVAERVRRACSEPFALSSGEEVRLTGSIGTAWSSDALSTPDALVAAADDAMYCAKQGSR